MTEQRHVDPDEDPVCGMRVDPDQARAKGLALTHEDHEYVFCSRGCMLDFKDDPAAYLETGYDPSM